MHANMNISWLEHSPPSVALFERRNQQWQLKINFNKSTEKSVELVAFKSKVEDDM